MTIRFWMLLAITLTLFGSTATRAEKKESCTGPVTLATLEWEPYIGPNMPKNGYVYALVEAAFERVGCKVDVAFLPWARALSVSEQGVREALFPEYYDASRESKFAFSDPFPGGPVGLFRRRDSRIVWPMDPAKNQTEALRMLKGNRFGVVRGYVNTKEFDEADFLEKDAAVDDEMNLRKLYKNRVQLIFIDKYVATHIMVTKYPWYLSELEFMEPPLEVKDLYVAFSKASPNWESRLKQFNRGLRLIREEGTLGTIIEESGF